MGKMGKELSQPGVFGVLLFTGGTWYTMLHPPLEAFSDKTKSRYALVVATSKRARQLVNGEKPLIETKSDKPVTIAMEEVISGKVTFKEPGVKTK